MSYHDPDQYTEPQSGLEPVVKEAQPTSQQQAVINQVGDWIDPDCIACVVAEELADRGIPVTFEACQKLWLRVLEDLHNQVSYAITDEF